MNFQAHCSHLFHFDVPWNPARLEQRNGRIDRKLQPSAEVFCHYYVYTQRPDDRVLQALIRKTGIIRRERGSLAPVISARLAAVLKGGINRGRADRLAAEIAGLSLESEQRSAVEEELEAARERQDALRKQIDGLRVRINDARRWIGLDHDHFREALSCSFFGEPPRLFDRFPRLARGLARRTAEHSMPESLSIPLSEFGEILAPTAALRDAKPQDADQPWLLLVQELPLGTSLDRVVAHEPNGWAASPTRRFERLLRDTRVPIGLLGNGTHLRLVYAPRGENAGTLTFRVKDLLEVAGRPILGAFHMLLKRSRLLAGAVNERLPAILARSREYQTRVSTQRL